MVRVKKQVQVLPVSIAEAWAYFSRPENLNEITPPDLSFTILSELPDRVYAGFKLCAPDGKVIEPDDGNFEEFEQISPLIRIVFYK